MPARTECVHSGGDRTKAMCYVYVIKSKIADFYYKGCCQDIEARLKQHNAGMTISNRPYAPFDIVYFERCDTKEEALAKEKYWKSAAGRRYLKNKI